MPDETTPQDVPPEAAPAAVPESVPNEVAVPPGGVVNDAAPAQTQGAPEAAPVESESTTSQQSPVPTSPSDAPQFARETEARPPEASSNAAGAPQTVRATGHFGRYSVKEAQDMSNAARAEVFAHRAEKILGYVREHGSISRKQAELLLHVSPNSALLYLRRLEKEGKLRREGKSRAVRYVVVSGEVVSRVESSRM